MRKAKKIALVTWLSAVALGALSVGAKAAGYFTLGALMYGLCVFSGIVFVGCAAFLVISALILVATGGTDRGVDSEK